MRFRRRKNKKKAVEEAARQAGGESKVIAGAGVAKGRAAADRVNAEGVVGAAAGVVVPEAPPPRKPAEDSQVLVAKALKRGTDGKCFPEAYYDDEERAEYQVMVHVIEARELASADSSDMSDPVVNIRAFGEKQHTTIKKRTANCTWDELFTFKGMLTDDSFAQEEMVFNVMDADTFTRDDLIGRYSLDLMHVYSQPEHHVKAWLLLTGAGEEEGIRGYLRVGIVVLGPGDHSNASLGEDDDDDGGDGLELSGMLLRPPNMDVQGYHCIVNVYRADDIPKLDKFGHADPFFRCNFSGGKPLETKVQKKTGEPTWDEAFLFSVITPSLKDRIDLDLYDYDRGSKNDFIARLSLKFSDIKSQGLNPTWFYMYGVPASTGPEDRLPQRFATEYKGKVLVAGSVVGSDSNKPVQSVSSCGHCPEPEVASYVVRVDLFEIIDLPAGGDVSIVVEVAGHKSEETKETDCSKGRASVYTSIPDLPVSLPVNSSVLPPVLIKIIQDRRGIGQRVTCFLRLEMRDVLDGMYEQPDWQGNLPYLNDKDDQDDIVGYSMVRVTCTPESATPARTPVRQPDFVDMELRAIVYQARNLESSDASGFNDPRAHVRVGNQEGRTLDIKETNAPVWNEVITLRPQLPEDLHLAPPVTIQVFDHDALSGADLIGRCLVDMDTFGETATKPTWYDLHMDDINDTTGQILCSFQLVSAARSKALGPAPTTVHPDSQESIIQVSLVGCRNLTSPGFYDVDGAIVEASLGSMETTTLSQPNVTPTPTNPNHLEVLEIKAELPVDPVFAPTLVLHVMDKKPMGKTITLGVAEVDLARYITQESATTTERKGRELVVQMPNNVEELEDTTPDMTGQAGCEECHDSVATLYCMNEEMPLCEDCSTFMHSKPKRAHHTVSPYTPEMDLLHHGNADEDGAGIGGEASGGASAGEEVSLVGGDEVSVPMQSMEHRTLPDVDPKPLMEEEPEPEGRLELATPCEAMLDDIPFHEWDLYRGANRALSGSIKANIRVSPGNRRPVPFNLPIMFAQKPVVVRVYVMRALHLVPQESGGADPYIKLSFQGGQVIEDKSSMQENTLRPNFNKGYDIETMLPGVSDLTIGVWDYDAHSHNELMGETVIDLEDRYFSDQWKQLAKKPIEQRPLWSPDSRAPQGKIEVMIEIMSPEEARATPMKMPRDVIVRDYELRVVIWSARNVVKRDAKMSDIFVSGTFAGDDKTYQKTDTHYRSKDGEGLWNWRFKYKMKWPSRFPRLKLQVWDNDLTNPDDAIAEAILDLKGFCKRAAKEPEGLCLDHQWIQLTHPSREGVQGELEVSLELLNDSMAKQKPNACEREEPNNFPHLDEPERPNAFPPWRLDKLGKEFMWDNKFKIMLMIGIPLLILFIALIIYIVITKKQYDAMSGNNNNNNNNDQNTQSNTGGALGTGGYGGLLITGLMALLMA